MAEAIKFGVTATGTIANKGQTVNYTVNLAKGDGVHISAGGDISPQIKLFGPDGTLISEGAAHSEYLGIIGKANLTGTYKVLLSDFWGGSGDYGLTVQRTNNPGNAISAKFGVPILNSIDNYAEEDSYSFTAQTGDQIYISSGGVSPRIKLFGPDGTLVSEGIADSERLWLQGRANLTGTYTVLVGSYWGYGTGDYGLNIQRTNNSGNTITTKFGVPVNGSIDNSGEEDSYKFVGKANTKVSLNVGGKIASKIKLFGPDGSLIRTAQTDSQGSNLTSLATLTQNGNYTVIVGDYWGYGRGDYSLTVSSLGKPTTRNIKGTSSSNTLEGDYGYDNISGLGGSDILNGLDGNDKLIGGDGNDQLNGGTGEDILDGGKSSDVLTGEQGKDKFLFNTGRKFQTGDIGIDTITDFDPYSDKIVLDKTTFTSLNSIAGNGFSVTGEFAVVKENTAVSGNKAEIVYNSTTGELFYNPNGVATNYGEGGLFATLTGNPALTKASFILQA